MEVDATIVRIKTLSPTVKSFHFDLGGADLSFLPGQWVDFYVDTGSSTEVGGFSITSSPLKRGTLELAIKKLPHGPAAIYLHEQAKVGDSFLVQGGFGGFYFDQDWDGPLMLIAGGIGITPFMSMLRYLDEAGRQVETVLLYSASSPSELLFRQELQALEGRNPSIKCVFTVTRPHDAAWEGRVGRIDPELIQEHMPARDCLYYLCGPPALQDDLSSGLAELGADPFRIKAERWW